MIVGRPFAPASAEKFIVAKVFLFYNINIFFFYLKIKKKYCRLIFSDLIFNFMKFEIDKKKNLPQERIELSTFA